MSIGNEQIQFGFAKIETTRFSLNKALYDKDTVISFQSNIGFGIIPEHQILGISLGFQFLHQEKQPFLDLELAFDFKIEEQSWKNFIDKNNVQICFPLKFATHLAVIVVGTARGVMHERIGNSELGKFIIPPVDLTQLIKGDIIMKLNDNLR